MVQMPKTRHRFKHTRASVIRRAQVEYDALDAIVRRLRPADLERYAFDERARIRWKVKDVIAHLTAWKLRDVRRMTRDRSPLRPYDAPYGAGTHEPNALIWERSHRTPAKKIVAEHRAAHRATLKAIRAAPAEYFAKHHSRHWPYDIVHHLAQHRRQHLEPLFAEPAKR
jgi:hypothetical protein